MIKSLNISLTNKCSANCIYCPNDRGECDTSTTGFMTEHCFKTLIQQARDIPELEQVTIGENGDCFLYPKIIEYLEHIRTHLPFVKIHLFTNLQTCTTEQLQIIIQNKLVDKIICNIDSIDPEQYKQAKNADFYKAWHNFISFILLRIYYKQKIPLTVNIIDPVMYRTTFINTFKNIPYAVSLTNWNRKEDKTKQTINTVKELLSSCDIIQGLYPCFWAERDELKQIPILKDVQKLKDMKCPQINRIQNEAFIRPDGTWYACCLDSKQELKIGNIFTEPLIKIRDSEKRKELLDMLKKGQFEKIGSPCDTVIACLNYKLRGKENE